MYSVTILDGIIAIEMNFALFKLPKILATSI